MHALRCRWRAELAPVEVADILKQLAALPITDTEDKGVLDNWLHYSAPNQIQALLVFTRVVDGRVVGLSQADGPKYRVQAGFWVMPGDRGQGYGSAIAKALAQRLVEDGYTGLSLTPVTATPQHQRAADRVLSIFKAEFERLSARCGKQQN